MCLVHCEEVRSPIPGLLLLLVQACDPLEGRCAEGGHLAVTFIIKFESKVQGLAAESH